MPNGGAGDLDLRILQLCIGNLRGQPMKNLAGKHRRRQALRRFREVTHPIGNGKTAIRGGMAILYNPRLSFWSPTSEAWTPTTKPIT